MSGSALEHLKILIVEDNQHMRALLRSLLNSVGIQEILEASHGGAALDVLRDKRIAGAALDVFHPEPLPPDHEYWTLPNLIITPHLGGVFDESPKRAMPIVEENVRRYLAGDFDNMINRVKH